MQVLERSPLHFVMVIDEGGALLGTVTDGDVRRALLRGVPTSAAVAEVMNAHPIVLREPYSRKAALALVRRHGVRQFPVVDADHRVIKVEWIDATLAAGDHSSAAVIMAGGMGRRLRPLTDALPKPLLPVGGKPVVEIVIEGLVASGFRQVTLCVNHMADLIMDAVGDGSRWGIDVRYVRESESLGTAGGLALVDPPPSSPLLVINADVVTRCNFRELLDFHAKSGAVATMCVRQLELQIPYGVIRVEHQSLAAIEEKPLQTFLINAGIYVLEPEIVLAIGRGESLDMTMVFTQLIEQRRRTSVFPLYEYWVDIGRHQDLQQANLEFRPAEPRHPAIGG
jgi:dTDP-glucose pyrophosphorylase